MIEARIAATSLQEAVVEVERYGLPGPVFCDVCAGNCGAAHVYFLNTEVDDDAIIEQLQLAVYQGLRLVDATKLGNPDGSRLVVQLDSSLLVIDEAN